MGVTHKPLLKAHPGRDSRGRMYNMYEGEYAVGGVIPLCVQLHMGVHEPTTGRVVWEDCVWKFNGVRFIGFDALANNCLPGLLNSDDPSWNAAKVTMPRNGNDWHRDMWTIQEVLEFAADTETKSLQQYRYMRWQQQQERKESWRKVRLGLAAEMKTAPLGESAQGLMQIVPGTFPVRNIEFAPDPMSDLLDAMTKVAESFKTVEGIFQIKGDSWIEGNKTLLDCDIPDQPFPVRTPNTGPNKKESHAARIKRSQQLPHANARADTGAHRLGAVHPHTRRGRENRTRARS